MNAAQLMKKIKAEEIRFVNFRFTDFCGKFHHITVPADEVDAAYFAFGKNFDGSSIPGWRAIEDSDMVLKPDLSTAVMDPFVDEQTLVLICDVYEPADNKPYKPLPAFHCGDGDGIFAQNRNRRRRDFWTGTGVFYF